MAMTTTETPATTEGTALIEARIRAILERVAGLEGCVYSAQADLFRDLGVKSIAALDLLLSLEEEFGVAISDEAFGQARSVGELVSLVQEGTR
jgi:acyl carrier protein